MTDIAQCDAKIEQRKCSMKKLYVAITAIVVMALTNPSLESHRERVREYVVSQASHESGVFANIGKLLGLQYVAGDVAASATMRVNFCICSVGKIEDSVVSFGVMGFVFIVD